MIHETMEPVKHCVFLYMTERRLKNIHNSYISYRSLLRVDMCSFYINICAMFSTVYPIFHDFVIVYNRKGKLCDITLMK